MRLPIKYFNYLVKQGGSADRVMTIGHGSNGFVNLVEKSIDEFHFENDWDFPTNIVHKGLSDLTNYHFRDDSMMLWNAINQYVEDIVNIFYLTDEDIQEDYEIQDWINEIFR